MGRDHFTMRVTIKDIAAAARVSPAVVSAVLNRNKSIRCSEEKRQLILELVRNMGYRPNRAAQVLGKRKSRQIGVLSYSPSDPSVARIIGELERQISERGYSAVFGFWSDYASIETAFDSVLAHPLDGLISMHNGLIDAVPEGLPTVYYGDVPGKCCVKLDYRQYFEQVLTLLAGLGHKTIGFVCWHHENLHELFCSVCAEKGLQTSPFWSPEGSGFYENALETALELLRSEERPDALICRNDVVAFAVINAAKQCGLRVPEDISVVGFDDIAPASYFIPPLTTCGAPAEKIASTLLEILFTGAEPGMTLIDMDLIIRGTCSQKNKLQSTIFRKE